MRLGAVSVKRSLPKAGLHVLALAAAGALCALAVSCGGSSGEGVARVDSGGTTTTASDLQSGSGSGDPEAFAACMRRNGVPTPETAEGTPAFEAAKTACMRFAPSGDDDAPDPRDRAEQLQLVLRYAACMRENGVPKFPDPEPDSQGYVKIGSEDLLTLGVDSHSPKYRAAADACEDLAP